MVMRAKARNKLPVIRAAPPTIVRSFLAMLYAVIEFCMCM